MLTLSIAIALNVPAIISSAVNPAPVPKVRQFQFPSSSLELAIIKPAGDSNIAIVDSASVLPSRQINLPSSQYILPSEPAILFKAVLILPSSLFVRILPRALVAAIILSQYSLFVLTLFNNCFCSSVSVLSKTLWSFVSFSLIFPYIKN